MPEGDTIHRTASTLDRALAGKVLVRFEAPRLVYAPFPAGTVVEGATAIGKHCVVHFDDGRMLRTHMRMTGSWHVYKPGERWRKRATALRALVAVEDWVAVCFAAPEVELVTHTQATDHLGPDLCLPDADVARAAQLLVDLSPPDREIGDALLDQRIACGVGNVWKSETLFAERVDPFVAVGALTDDQRLALLTTAARLLREQVERPGGVRQVYGRRGQPCRRCGTPIAWRPQGPHGRGTYWCPSCQTSLDATVDSL